MLASVSMGNVPVGRAKWVFADTAAIGSTVNDAA